MRTAPERIEKPKRFYAANVTNWTAGAGDNPGYPRVVLDAPDWVRYGPDYPDYALRLLLGQSATTSLEGEYTSAKFFRGEVTYRLNASQSGSAWGTNWSPNMPISPSHLSDSVADQQARVNLLESYIAATQSWNGGAAIAEFGETVSMLREPLKSVLNETFTFIGRVGRLKRVFRRDPVDYAKRLGSAWLLYAFGIKPFVGDVNDAMKACNVLSQHLGSVDTLRILGTGKRKVIRDRTPNVGVSPGGGIGGYWVHDRNFWTEYSVRYLGAVKTRPPGYSDVASNFGVGFEDILPSVWEGVPWSFLVDYFINVNDMLNSMRWATVDFAWLQRTIRNKAVNQVTELRRLHTLPASTVTSQSGGSWYLERKTVNRTVQSTAPYPSFQFKIPGTLTKIANISSLYLAIRESKPLDKWI
jgi:hypothetical protein